MSAPYQSPFNGCEFVTNAFDSKLFADLSRTTAADEASRRRYTSQPNDPWTRNNYRKVMRYVSVALSPGSSVRTPGFSASSRGEKWASGRADHGSMHR